MPFEPVAPYGDFVGQREPNEPQRFTDVNPETRPFQPAEPTTSDAFEAAWRTDNTLVSALVSQATPMRGKKLDPDFDPWAEIADTPYQPYYEYFAAAADKDHFEAIKADIMREAKDRQTIEDTGWTGIGASMAAGFFDPTFLIPGGAVVRR